jgi:hypothetical protein
VQLEIDEHFLAAFGQLRHQRKAAGVAELIADLVEAHAVAEPRDQRFRRLDTGRSSATISRSREVNVCWLHGFSRHLLGDVDQLAQRSAQQFGIGRIFRRSISSNA